MDPMTLAFVGFGLVGAGRLMVRHASTRPENLGKHPIRAHILETVKAHPGLNVSELSEAVGRPWGTLQHHLYLLRRAELVQDVALGRDHRYFPAGMAQEEAQRVAILRQSRVWDFVKEVLHQPGVRQRAITQNIGMSRKVVRAYVDLLKGAGLLDEARPSTKMRTYFPTPALRDAMSSLGRDENGADLGSVPEASPMDAAPKPAEPSTGPGELPRSP